MSNFSIKQIRGGVSITKYLGEEIEITVPDTIDGYRVLKIEDKCFFGNKKVKKIIISDNVESIGELAFYIKERKMLWEIEKKNQRWKPV